MAAPKLMLPKVLQDLLASKDRRWVDHYAVNEFAQAHGAQRAILYQHSGRRFRIAQVTGQAQVNKDSPYLQDVQAAVQKAYRMLPDARAQAFRVETDDAFRQGVLLMGPKSQALALLRPQPWGEEDIKAVTDHAHILWLHRNGLRASLDQARHRLWRLTRAALIVAALVASVIIQIPVRVVAPARVVPSDPLQITAPVSGRIDQVFSPANSSVSYNDPIVRFEDTVAQGRYKQAVQAEMVAAQRLTQLQKTSFASVEARQQLPILEAELKLATVERETLEAELGRYLVGAPRSGTLDIPPMSELQGAYKDRGAPIGRVFDPTEVEIKVDVATDDLMVLTGLDTAYLFLNDGSVQAQPLGAPELPLAAGLDDRGGVSYPVIFDWPSELDIARVGAEGIVRLHGPERPVIYVILRRPINWLMNWLWV